MRLRKIIIGLLGLIVAVAGLLPQAAAAQGQTSQRCFTETGFCIAGPIRSYWERNGGLSVFGYPIAEQRLETVEGRSLQVQWFERDRLEIQLNGTVTAGRLGARYLELAGRPWSQGMPMPYNPDCTWFPQTGYNLCGAFRSYWQRNGGLERFGYPIGDPTDEFIGGQVYTVQYFERRRMEYHPENVGTPYEVLLGLLGKEVYAMDQGGGRPQPDIDINRDQARIAMFEFFSALARRDYGAAADLYGGDMSQLAAWNPDIRGDIYGDRGVRAVLLRRGCEFNGLVCMEVRGAVAEQKTGPDSYRFTVEFSTARGGLFRHPVSGQTRFDYDVAYNGARYVVLQLPPYVN